MTLPAMMKASVINGYGTPDVLTLQDVLVPDVGVDDLLIKVESAGVASWDADERSGKYHGYFGFTTTFPYALGWDGAGTVVAVGSNVKRFKVGDTVYAGTTPLPRGGFYADYTVVAQKNASHLPAGLSVAKAGVLAWDALTGLSGLNALDMKKGESLMVFGASGGMGHLVVQFAKRKGVRVFAVASGDDGVELIRDLGVDKVIDGRKEDIVSLARQFALEGLDAALLTAGGPAANQALITVREGGRIAWPNGVMPVPQPPVHAHVFQFDGHPSPDTFAELNELIEQGPFEVHVAQTLPLAQASKAHELLDRHFIGKLALQP